MIISTILTNSGWLFPRPLISGPARGPPGALTSVTSQRSDARED